jgi:hypothetical protein
VVEKVAHLMAARKQEIEEEARIPMYLSRA